MEKKKKPRGATSTPTGRQNVILERIEEAQRAVVEAVIMNREALERRIDDLDQKLSSRLDALELAFRANSADIQGLSDKLDTKGDASRVSALEGRVELLEGPGAP